MTDTCGLNKLCLFSAWRVDHLTVDANTPDLLAAKPNTLANTSGLLVLVAPVRVDGGYRELVLVHCVCQRWDHYQRHTGAAVGNGLHLDALGAGVHVLALVVVVARARVHVLTGSAGGALAAHFSPAGKSHLAGIGADGENDEERSDDAVDTHDVVWFLKMGNREC